MEIGEMELRVQGVLRCDIRGNIIEQGFGEKG